MTHYLKQQILYLPIICFFCSSIGMAETVMTSHDLKNSPRINNYVNAQPLLQLLFKVGEIQDKKFNVQQDCKSKRKVRPIGVIVTSPIDFPSELKHPKAGSWIYKFEYERCNVKSIYNADFKVTKPGEPVAVGTYFSGTTLASKRLILDAANTVLPLVKVESGMKDCKNTRIQDMKVLEQPHDVREGEQTLKQVWKENWLFNICGKIVSSDMVFYKNESRGGFSFFTENTKLVDK